MKNILIHIPHDGHKIPKEFEKFLTISKEEFKHYDFMMSDINLDRISKHLPYKRLIFPYSRLICDVEKFLYDEPMEKYGMGFCYSRTFDDKPFKIITEEVINLTKRYYQNYHDILNSFAFNVNTPSLLLDLHSFNIKAMPNDLKQGKMPDICIGYDEEYCNKQTRDLLYKTAVEFGYSVEINHPYSGSMVPQAVLSGLKIPLQSIMIELNRDCYKGSDNITIPREHWRFYNMLDKFLKSV